LIKKSTIESTYAIHHPIAGGQSTFLYILLIENGGWGAEFIDACGEFLAVVLSGGKRQSKIILLVF
jgi:hypothetical protein